MTDLIPASAKIVPDVAARLAPFVTRQLPGELAPVLTVAKERGQTRAGKVLNRIGAYGSPLWVSGGILGAGNIIGTLLGAVDPVFGLGPLVIVTLTGFAGTGLSVRANIREERVGAFVHRESRDRLERFLKERFGIKASTWGLDSPKGNAHDDVVRTFLSSGELTVTDKSGARFKVTATRAGDGWRYTALDAQGQPPRLNSKGKVVNELDERRAIKAKPESEAQDPIASLGPEGFRLWRRATELLAVVPAALPVEQAHVVARARTSLAEIGALSERLGALGKPDAMAVTELNRALEGVVESLARVVTAEMQQVRHEAQVLARYVAATSS